MVKTRRADRIPFFDNLKFKLTVLVVLGHFIQGYRSGSEFYRSLYLMIYAFHMPLFLFISGQFHSNYRVKVRVLALLAIGFAMKIAMYLVPLTLEGSAPDFQLFSGSSIYWYVFVLAYYSMASYCFRDIDRGFLLIMSVVLACFAGYDSGVGDEFYLSRAITFYPFYVLGEAMDKDEVIEVSKAIPLKLIALLILGVWGAACFLFYDRVGFLQPLFLGRYPYSVDENILRFGWMYRLLCYVITILTGLSVLALTSRDRFVFVTRAGNRTLQAYFWHTPLLQIMSHYHVPEFFFALPWGEWQWLGVAVLLTFLLSFRIFGFPVNIIIHYCRYEDEYDL